MTSENGYVLHNWRHRDLQNKMYFSSHFKELKSQHNALRVNVVFSTNNDRVAFSFSMYWCLLESASINQQLMSSGIDVLIYHL